MKIISLNTWSGVVLDPLLRFIETNKDVDVFCLQEVYKDAVGVDDAHPFLDMKLDIFEKIDEILKNTHDGYFRPAYKHFYGLAIFVKKNLPVHEEGEVVIYENDAPKQRGMHGRNLQYIRVEHDAQPLVIAHVHGLWNGQGKTDTDDRLSQSQRIKEFVSGQTDQVVLMGGFNLNPDTRSLALIAEGMVDLVKEFGITSTRTSLYEKPGKFADYCFVSPEVDVKDFRVLPDVVSDHAPLLLEL